MENDTMRFAASFLLGKMHMGLIMSLEAEVSDAYKLEMISALERQLRADINNLYYSNPHNPDKQI